MKRSVHIFIVWAIGGLTIALGQQTVGSYPNNPAFTALKNEVDSLVQYISSNAEIPALGTVKQLKSLLKRTNEQQFPVLEEQVQATLGLEYQHLGQHQEAETAYRESLRKARALPNADSLLVANRMTQLGRLYLFDEKYANALRYLWAGLRLREQYHAPINLTTYSYVLLAMTYTRMADFAAAEKYYQQAINIKIAAKDTSTMGIIYVSMADLYRLQKKYVPAANYLKYYLERRLPTKNKEGIMDCYRSLAYLYDDWGKFAEAEDYYLKALETTQSIKRKRIESRLMLGLAGLYDRFGYAEKAKKLYQQAGIVSNNTQSLALQGAAFLELAKLNDKQGNHALAYNYLTRYVQRRDSLENEESQKKLSELRAQFEVEQKEREIADLDRQNKEQLRQRNLLLISLLCLSLLTAIVIYFYFARRKASQKLAAEKQQTQALLEEKERLLDNLHATQVHLIHTEKMASLGLLTAGIAHEINNPISFINASMEALKMDFLELNPVRKKILALQNSNDLEADVRGILVELKKINAEYVFEEMSQLMLSIEKGTLRTTEIVAGLRTFSRDTGEVFAPANINNGIDATLTLLGHKLMAGIEIEKEYGNLPLVPCQFSRLNQVFLNLLDNAIHAVQQGGTIHIRTTADAQNAYIFIADNGQGMDEATRKRIFEPFYTTKEVGQGTGLGLSISYAIVQQHQGTIEVESAVGEGTRFKLTLPL